MESYRIYLQAYAACLRDIVTPTEGASLPVCIAVALASFDTAGETIESPRAQWDFAQALNEMMTEEAPPCA